VKFGICSEIFKDWNDIERTCDYVKSVGYDGLEVAPFTFAPFVGDIPAATREQIVRAAAAVDLDIVGIHWVFVGPDGVHLTHPDREVRDFTAQYLVDLVDFVEIVPQARADGGHRRGTQRAGFLADICLYHLDVKCVGVYLLPRGALRAAADGDHLVAHVAEAS